MRQAFWLQFLLFTSNKQKNPYQKYYKFILHCIRVLWPIRPIFNTSLRKRITNNCAECKGNICTFTTGRTFTTDRPTDGKADRHTCVDGRFANERLDMARSIQNWKICYWSRIYIIRLLHIISEVKWRYYENAWAFCWINWKYVALLSIFTKF